METTQKPKEIIGHLMVLSTIIIYSFNTNFMKILMPEWIAPHGLALIRCTVMVLGFWIISLFIPASKQQAKPKRKDILMMMLGGLLGISQRIEYHGTRGCFRYPYRATHRRDCTRRTDSSCGLQSLQGHRYRLGTRGHSLRFNHPTCRNDEGFVHG